MRAVSYVAVAAGLLTATNALTLVQRDTPKVALASIQRREVRNPVARDRLRRRQSNTVTATLDNLETLYFANCTLGTPPQNLRLHLDTGSSDLWANSAQSNLCTSQQDACVESGTYSANSSSTYNYVNSVFNISYVDGSGAAGDYVTDTLRIGGITLTDQQFGVGYASSSQEGILGIGYPINEVQTNRAGLNPYPNVPVKMVQEGFINANAYSLWLNDLDSSTGSILFGGVNTEKYVGSLQTVPILPEDAGAGQEVYAEFVIGMSGLGTNGNAGSIANNINEPVLLDSGSSLMYLPNDLTRSIYNLFGAQYDSRQGAAFVDCDLQNNDTTLDFSFGSALIRVPSNELVIEAARYRGQTLCILGISPADGSTSVLGDTFLRSAYVVYNLQENEISLAQTNFNSTQDNILEITNGTNGVPDATGAANAIASATLSGGGARNGGQPSVTGTAASASSTGLAPVMTAAPMMGALAAGAAGLLFAL